MPMHWSFNRAKRSTCNVVFDDIQRAIFYIQRKHWKY